MAVVAAALLATVAGCSPGEEADASDIADESEWVQAFSHAGQPKLAHIDTGGHTAQVHAEVRVRNKSSETSDYELVVELNSASGSRRFDAVEVAVEHLRPGQHTVEKVVLDVGLPDVPRERGRPDVLDVQLEVTGVYRRPSR